MHPVLLVLALTLAQATPTPAPTAAPTATPTAAPSATPTVAPTPAPTLAALPLHYGYLNLPLGGYLRLPSGVYTSGTYTVELWVYLTANTEMGRLFEMSSAQDANAIVFTAAYSVGGVPGLMNFNALGSYSLTTANDPISTGMWVHVAATTDAVGQVAKLYVNAELVASSNITHVTSGVTHPDVFIGHSVWPGQGPFAGRVAEFRFWNLVRTQAQLNASKDAVLVGNELGLQVNYRFDECVGNTTADLSPNARTGTLYANASLVCACDAGFYYNSSACVACEVGRYANASGATMCIPCEAGRIGDSLGSTCNDCGFGQFANRTGMSQCDMCDPGYYSGTGAFTACLPCAYGSYTGGSGAFQCDTCGNGTYAPLPAATVCTNCSVFSGNATYCPTAPTSAPTANPTATPTRAPTATPTRAPTAAPSAAPTPAPTSACDMGTSFNGTDCVPCAAGRYADTTGLTTCLPCATGRFSASASATVCNTCTAGSFGNETGLTACFPCEVGTFAADDLATACTPCPFGLFARAAGATVCVSEGNVPLATERLNRTEITLLAAPLSSITVTPLVAASCAVPSGFRTVEMFRATGSFSGVVDVHFASNGTRQFWPRDLKRGDTTIVARDLYTCVDGSWVPSYQYQCGANATARLESTDDLWGRAYICHFTEFAVLDVDFGTEFPFCDPLKGADNLNPRICLRCARPSNKDCDCLTEDSDNLALERPEIRVAIAGIVFLFAARAVAMALRVLLDESDYQEVQLDSEAPLGVRNEGPLFTADVALAFMILGAVLYMVPVMAHVETSWVTHNLTRSQITRMFWGAIGGAVVAEVLRHIVFWILIVPRSKDIGLCGRLIGHGLILVFDWGAAAGFFSSQSALYAPALEVQTAGAAIDDDLTGTGVWDNLSTANQYAIPILFLELATHALVALLEFVSNIRCCSKSTKSKGLYYVFLLRCIPLMLAAIAWILLRARHTCE